MILHRNEHTARSEIRRDGVLFERIRITHCFKFSTQQEADSWQPPEPPDGFKQECSDLVRHIFQPHVTFSADYRRPK